VLIIDSPVTPYASEQAILEWLAKLADMHSDNATDRGQIRRARNDARQVLKRHREAAALRG